MTIGASFKWELFEQSHRNIHQYLSIFIEEKLFKQKNSTLFKKSVLKRILLFKSITINGTLFQRYPISRHKFKISLFLALFGARLSSHQTE